MIEQFEKVKKVLEDLEAFRDNVPGLVDELLPVGQASVVDLRELALAVMAEANDAGELFSLMMKEITQPDIPPEVKEVRVMSLNKSKGLSSPYVFIAQCLQGVLPKIQKEGTPQVVVDARLEEARCLFFVGITRVKAGGGHAVSLFLTYPREMGANTAKGLGIPFTKTVNGRAQLTPSMFIQELGPKAPAPVAGNA
jgi:DNA helicase-2/ATP-dependent DNA helicase PcrA